MSLRLTYAAPIGGDLTLVVGPARPDSLESKFVSYRGPDGEDQFAAVVQMVELDLDADKLDQVAVDLQTLMRRALAPLPATTRTEVLDFIVRATASRASNLNNVLARNLMLIREALRERLMPSIISRDEPIGLSVECVLRVDERHYFVQGWYRDAESPVSSLRAISPEGASAELLDTIYRFPRADLESLYGVPTGDERAGTGFACSIELAIPSTATSGWLVELRDAAGVAVEAGAPTVTTNQDDVRGWLLGNVDLERPGEDSLIRHHLHPALLRMQERNAQRVRIDRTVQFGLAPATPEVSVIVPLYRRIDLMEHQLAQFALDPEISNNDLIYVLDSPELSRELLARSAALFDLYRVPFRVVLLRQNVGFAGANNAGASVADGRLLLFMNSDVLPETPGWLGELVSFHDSKPRAGAVGPKLLFEDGSIQHAGLYFRRPPSSLFWENEHFFKGMHRDAAGATTSRVVPAVTAACMLVSLSLFLEVGGFSGSYVRGDYEDSELCLRLRDAGHDNWYCADVALHHLEGQSYETALRVQAWKYNGWLHTHLWGQRIEEIMGERPASRAKRRTRARVNGAFDLGALKTDVDAVEAG